MLHKYDPESDRRAFVPVGKPAANTQIYILDENLKPVAENVLGELYISGAGLAAGYLNREELTKERFIANPFREGEKMYRSGDVARWLPGGVIEFVGRRDEQVKFHGYRVELNEIRSALNKHAQVRDSVVTLHREAGGNDALVAYYVARQKVEPEQLREHLSEYILNETIPNFFVHLKRLPLTLNGKVNHAALPTLEAIKGQSRDEYVAPQTEVEEIVAGIWATLLGVPQVGRYDNFFQLGGHSLLATQLVSRVRKALQVELTVRSLFEHPTVNQLSTHIQTLSRNGLGKHLPPMSRANREAGWAAPLSFAQQRLWFIDQLVPGSTFYNVSSAVRLEGKLDISALERTISEVARRHEVLRTTFRMVDGEPAQVIAPVQPIALPVTDLSELSEPEREEELRQLLSGFSAQPFDLAQDSLLRVRLVRLGEDSHAVMLVTHHIVCDGWSMGVLVKEVVAIYEAFSRGEPSPLPELAIQYADFAVWQREWLRGETLEQQLSYWRAQLRGAPPVLELPTDRPRPAVQSYRGASHSFRVSAEVSAGLKALSRSEGATLFMTLLAAFKILLSRYSGQTDIVVGTPIAGRNRMELEPLIGFFVNTLALRTRLSGALSFREVLQQVRETALEAYAHEHLPFERIVEELNPERALSHTPLVQVVFGFQSLQEKTAEVSDLTMSALGHNSGTARFDVVQNMFETEEGLSGSLHGNVDLFDLETIKRLCEHFQRLLQSIVEHPDAAISQLALLSEEEREQQLVEWNETEVDFPDHLCFQQLFEQQVVRTPDAVAASCEGRTLTYKELNRRGNRLAHLLVERGAAQEVVVALLADRDLDLLVAVLAIFKAGAVYLPLDPNSPALRLAQVLDQSATPLVLATSGKQQLLEQAIAALPESRRPAVLQVDDLIDLNDERPEDLPSAVAAENLATRNSPSSLAYVIYTSGSTGVPKGAMVEQRGMVNHLFAKVRDLALTETDKVAQTASQCFDISVWQMLAVLLVGGQIEIFPNAVAHNAQRLLIETERAGVTILETVPSLLRAMLDEAGSSRYLGGLRWMIPTGEVLLPELCRRWLTTFPHVPLLNAYGPTECSDDVSHHPIHSLAATENHNTPIGRPIANLRLYVVDRQLRTVPLGVPGELCVGGVGVGRGYLLTPGRTAEAFVPDVFGKQEGRRLYRTGDQARFLPNGDIQFLGRIDHQVKLRGFRIELDEVEIALRESEEVIDAVAMVREDVAASFRLVAYLVWATEEGTQVERLQSRLKERLPEYMVPTAFVSLPAMPLTVNGKVDRSALPAPEQAGADAERSFVAPRTPLERWLVEKWASALNLETEQVGVEDSFFDLGGESIKAAIIVNRVQEALGEVVHVVTILDAPTIAGFAAFLESHYGPAVARLLGSEDARVVAEPREVEAVVTESKVAQLRHLSAEARQHIAMLGGEESVTERGDARRPSVLFLLSPPRSGSTLLRVLLGGHTRLFAPPELELLGFQDMGQRRAALSGRDKFWLEGAIRAVMQARDCMADEAQAIIGEYEARSATTTEFYRDLQEWIGAGRMLVDKTPSYALELEVLQRAEQEFGSDARYIHLVRRPEAMIHSYEEAHLAQIFPRFAHPFSEREVAELVWAVSQQNIQEFLSTVSAERQHRVVFEELVAEPRRVLEGVSEFLGLEYEAGMSEPYRERAERMTDGVRAESKMLGDVKFHEHRGIEANVGERWREAAADLEIGAVTRELAKSLGYDVQAQVNKFAPSGAQHKSLTPIRRVDEKANDEQIAADISVMSDQEVEAMLESVSV
jgi:amino acid adenylation domain-containing protein